MSLGAGMPIAVAPLLPATVSGGTAETVGRVVSSVNVTLAVPITPLFVSLATSV
ncbi:MAG: hypothetical protein JO038_06275 [Alphaproteobacteria bacterium]|nr:hypothetical protein [Alphaproteobacteria bacterium]